MALRIFITGSSDGIGLVAAQTLIKKGHSVTLHARNTQRAAHASKACPSSAGVLIGDLSSISQTKKLAMEANERENGGFDVVVHNAGTDDEGGYHRTTDGLSKLFAVNALAPYILTSLMRKPKNLVYVSSMMHMNGDPSLRDIDWKVRGEKSWTVLRIVSVQLHNVLLAFAAAIHWPDITSNALSPGWVRTKMGGPGATVSLAKGAELLWKLAEGEAKDIGTGGFWAGNGKTSALAKASEVGIQEEFLRVCGEISGVEFPK